MSDVAGSVFETDIKQIYITSKGSCTTITGEETA